MEEKNIIETKKTCKSKTIILSVLTVLIVACASLLATLILSRNESSKGSEIEEDNTPKEKADVEVSSYCSFGIPEGEVKSSTKTFKVSYEATSYYENEVASVNIIVTNEEGDIIINDECYNLSNENLIGFAINSDDTLTTLHSDNSDDPINFTVKTLDYAGKEISTKELTCENGTPKVSADTETVCNVE